MRIHCIFEEIKDVLYAVAYTDTESNILDTLQENWSDTQWLESFFEQNKEDLQSEFYGIISIEQAIERTIDEADDLFLRLTESDGSQLPDLFIPLDDKEYQTKDFQKQKLKGTKHKSWLRIYAVQFYDEYVITGGTIKLTHKMSDREHTKLELQKLRMVRDALKLNEIEDLFVYLDI